MTKKGNVWALATVEDLEGAIEVMFFPQTYQLVATQLAEDAVVVVKGRLDQREDVAKLIAMELTAARPVRGAARPGRHLAAGRPVHPAGGRAAQGGAGHPPGRHRGAPAAAAAARTTVLRLDDGLRVAPTPALLGDLKALLGPTSVV